MHSRFQDLFIRKIVARRRSILDTFHPTTFLYRVRVSECFISVEGNFDKDGSGKYVEKSPREITSAILMHPIRGEKLHLEPTIAITTDRYTPVQFIAFDFIIFDYIDTRFYLPRSSLEKIFRRSRSKEAVLDSVRFVSRIVSTIRKYSLYFEIDRNERRKKGRKEEEGKKCNKSCLVQILDCNDNYRIVFSKSFENSKFLRGNGGRILMSSTLFHSRFQSIIN